MTPWVRRLLAANAIIYLASQVYPVLFYQMLLVPAMIPTRPWTLITYMFLHDRNGFAHILFRQRRQAAW